MKMDLLKSVHEAKLTGISMNQSNSWLLQVQMNWLLTVYYLLLGLMVTMKQSMERIIKWMLKN
jgi:hypothetical protein